MTAARPILLLGSTGQVGTEIRAMYPGRRVAAIHPIVSPDRRDADLHDARKIRQLIRELAPVAIINAAAYTAVDRAESEREACFAINAEAPVAIAEEAARLGSVFVHYSTDYVFDGTADAYFEGDAVAPLNVYGESKAAAERGIADVAGRSLVFRTSWVFSDTGTNFVRTMLRLAREREELRVVDDQIGCPTSASYIARTTLELLDRDLVPQAAEPAPYGLYHLTSGAPVSWFGFAEAILRETPRPIMAKRVIPIRTADFPQAARRPPRSVLRCDKIAALIGLAPGWSDDLESVLRKLVDKSPSNSISG
jgi:dTDP-4-dehydrorhamnose reductase